ncbi:MAG TPA: amino acid-binding protein [Bacteroidales bacterium]|nr:amino acid-binding protein [Bacteroidales bacterium]HOK99830.1 amino acid-binding protein [Bacteroidales bacterium]HPO66233.1 amino acid-binding protein [Bacteroidales bacterium]
MIIKQLTVFLENKKGRLTEVTKVLSNNKINISALSIADTADFGLLRMIVDNPEKAEEQLKSSGFAVHVNEVICMIVPDEPGGLYRALEILTNADIGIEYLYAFSSENKKASVVIRTDEVQKTIDILQENQIQLIKANQLYKL